MSIDDLNYELYSFYFDASHKKLPSCNLYHYTSPEGMQGILEDQQLWFTRYDCLNDYSERKYIFDVYASVCKKLKNDERINMEFYDAIIGIEIDDLETLSYPDDSMHYGDFNCDYYVCCFSKNPDSLPMWNYYAKGRKYEGYNLEFTCFLPEYHQRKNNTKIEIVEVIYNRETQEKNIEEAIVRLESLMKKGIDISEVKSALSYFLKHQALVYKKDCFQHEEEVRIIIQIPKRGHKGYPIQYRVSHGILVPYIVFPFDKDAVMNITIGPLIHADVAEDTLRRYLQMKQYLLVGISKSEIPIRY